jgi:predicted Zn-dependent protease with MMP-like domain
MPHHVSKTHFRRLVDRALSELREPFAQAIHNMALEIRDRPTPRELKQVGLGPDELLLGLYVGVPLTERSVEAPPALPDKIYIFQDDCELAVDSEEELIREVRITVLHELGHYFGMDEEDLDDLGYG